MRTPSITAGESSLGSCDRDRRIYLAEKGFKNPASLPESFTHPTSTSRICIVSPNQKGIPR